MKIEATASAHGQAANARAASVSLALLGQPLRGKNRVGGSKPWEQQIPGVHHIEVNLRHINQLFNTMDPSPFHEKDLDRDAEEFIVSWAREFPSHEPVDLILHLQKLPEGEEAKLRVGDAVHNYFAYRERLNQLEFKRLMKQGRASLIVGLCFLLACLGTIQIFALRRSGTFLNFLSEGLTIAGWVAMWKPMEIYLYDWWPLRRRGQILDKLSRMPVRLCESS